ncbi:MAG: PilZ domain-containing protein [candidate division Zixibacteria bacterium]|nr:PilZ domain-containing protein [candidate division Zixibacteria bacterium]
MKEKRSLKRKYAREQIPVYDLITEQEVGRLVNLSTDGMQLITEEPVRTGSLCQFIVTLPALPDDPTMPFNVDVNEEVVLDARSVWCRKENNPDYYDAGFELMDMTSDEVRTIETALEDAMFQA